MKALRRSIKGDKKDHHVSITPKSAVAILPPKKVIKALYDYDAQSSQELSFQKGDFFHVIARENDTEWYEACNPAVPDARGLVPVNFFQALGKTERDSGQSATKIPVGPDHDSGYSEGSNSVTGTAISSPIPNLEGQRMSKLGGKGTGAMVYGIVMYDFAAERPDELEAKAGEAIIVIAQSNPEWFVAKPIGRLGGPGLIPVSFIEIRDMVTGQAVPDAHAAVQRAGVPKVEEWKKMAADYKNSSIELGKLTGDGEQDVSGGMARMSLQQAQMRQSQQQAPGQSYQQQMRQSQQTQNQQQKQQQHYQQHPGNQVKIPQSSQGQLLAPISACIPRYWFSEDKYWFVIECVLENGRTWELQRYYEDFYDFQIALLTEFPDEAGNTGTQKRTLPYMPGPVNYVTDQITEGRKNNLDAYVKNLLQQPPYISRCALVRQFFHPREGDLEVDPTAESEEGRYSGASGLSGEADSRQGSSANLNSGYGGLSAAPPRQQQQPNMGYPQQGQDRRQPSGSLAAPPLVSQQSSNSQATLGGALKVKIYFGDDVFAIRVQKDIAFQQLYEKIRERLKIPGQEEIVVSYKDERSGERRQLGSDQDLDEALVSGDKLALFVDYSDLGN